MSYAVKAVTTERGLDAGDFALIAYGGAGPLHAVEVAREIGITRVIIPAAPGVFSAFGMLFSDLRYDFVRTWPMRLEDADFDVGRAHLSRARGRRPPRRRRNLGHPAQGHGEARRRHALCRPGARRHRRSADERVRPAEPRRHQAPFRRDARAALRHLRARGAGRDRESAHHRHRRRRQADDAKDLPRHRDATARRLRGRARRSTSATAASCRRGPFRAPRSPPATASGARRSSRSMPRPRC